MPLWEMRKLGRLLHRQKQGYSSLPRSKVRTS